MARLKDMVLLVVFLAIAQAQDNDETDTNSADGSSNEIASADEPVRIPPSITSGPPRQRPYTTGEEVTLTCEATGIPEPEFDWFHNDVKFDKNTPGVQWNKGTITIVETTANFEGRWQCFAENQHGKSMSSFVELEMGSIAGYPPGTNIVEYQASPGDELRLSCDSLKSVPDASFSWSVVIDENDRTGGTAVVLSDRIQIDTAGNLYFSNIQSHDSQDGKLYKCNIYNPLLLITVGGSLSKVNVAPGSPTSKQPTITFQTSSPAVGLRTKDISLRCLFAGNPTPRVQWTRKDGSLPFGRNQITDKGTTLKLTTLEDGDEGIYVCSGANSENTATTEIQLMIHSEPVFVHDQDRPMNDNFTEGEDAHFKCHADAIPPAVVIWFINGDSVDPANPGPRRSISEDGLKLSITNLCKDCSGDPNHLSDLMNVQCMAENEHNYTFADAYLNVLLPTVLTTKPESIELEYGADVEFKCAATTDDSTPLTMTWERDDRIPIYPEADRIEILEDNTLHIITEYDDDEGASFEGKYTCIATNGYSEAFAVAHLTLPEGVAPVKGASLLDMWWIFLIVILILLILLLLLCCCLCMQRNRGDSYPVDEKERAQGNDPIKELEDDGYHDYQRPEEAPIKGSRASLTSTIKIDSEDEGSLNEYGGDLDTGKFNEDGSFIARNNRIKKHTFV